MRKVFVAGWLVLLSHIHIADAPVIKKDANLENALTARYGQKYLYTKIHFTTFANAKPHFLPAKPQKQEIWHLDEEKETVPYAFMSDGAINALITWKGDAPLELKPAALDKAYTRFALDMPYEKTFKGENNGRGVAFGYKHSMLFDEYSENIAQEIGVSQRGASPFARASANFGATLSINEKMLVGSLQHFDDMPKADVKIKTMKPVLATLSSPALELALKESDYKRSEKCLADAIYFESRSEPERGQIAVAQVIVNRALSGYYPDNICGVVYQNAHRYLSCQFTFACEGKKLVVTEPKHWADATRISKEMLAGKLWLKDVANATHYHASYVSPYWAKSMNKHAKIGLHHFFRPRNWN